MYSCEYQSLLPPSKQDYAVPAFFSQVAIMYGNSKDSKAI